jgi:hypothetical protein
MSQENAKIVRQVYDGWSRGDFSAGTGREAFVRVDRARGMLADLTVFGDRREALEAAGLRE